MYKMKYIRFIRLKKCDRQTDRTADIQTYRHTNIQTYRNTDKQFYRGHPLLNNAITRVESF